MECPGRQYFFPAEDHHSIGNHNKEGDTSTDVPDIRPPRSREPCDHPSEDSSSRNMEGEGELGQQITREPSREMEDNCIRSQSPMMKSMQRPFYKSSDTDSVQDLHVFVDASMTSYSAAAYICNGHQSALVMAKTRVAPLKRITPPRLELMAAVIGARLTKHITDSIQVTEVYLWSDSQVVLHWLQSKRQHKR